jgi:hypothetical protein
LAWYLGIMAFKGFNPICSYISQGAKESKALSTIDCVFADYNVVNYAQLKFALVVIVTKLPTLYNSDNLSLQLTDETDISYVQNTSLSVYVVVKLCQCKRLLKAFMWTKYEGGEPHFRNYTTKGRCYKTFYECNLQSGKVG